MYKNMRYRKKETKVIPVDDNACVICFREVNIYSVGQCDHPVCYECSTRMRVLCRRNECPICRQDLPKVIFSRVVYRYDDIKDKELPLDSKYNIAFASEDVEIAFNDLLVHICPDCKKIFETFKCLWEHVRRVHGLSYCDLCVDNLNILTKERKCYTKKGLAEHKAAGDKDDKSHKGHPMCEFCHTRYMDNDALYRHVRRDHLFCHFCDADGIHQYYKSHDSLRKHFREEHFVCEEGECYMESFTSVFRTEIDLKAHKAATHGKNMTRAGLRQARTLDIEFQLAPRPRLPNNRRQNRVEEGDVREELEERQERNNTVGVDYQQEFPSLDGTSSNSEVPSTSKLQTRHFQITSRLHSGSVPESNNENYPALPNAEASVKVHLNSDQFKNLSIKVKTTVTTEKMSNIDRTNQEQYPPLSGSSSKQSATATQWTAKDVKTNTKKKIIKSNHNPPTLEDFPALVPESLTKKVSNFSQTVEPEPESEQLFIVKKKKKKSKVKNVDQGPSLKGNEKKTEVKTKQEAKSVPALSVNEKPTTTNKVIQDNREVPVETNTNKINTNEKTLTKPPDKDIKKLKDDEFPALVSGTSTKSAPPGFEWKVKRPPPGLKIPEHAPPIPPTTFSALDDSLFPSLIGHVGQLGEYLEPSNFAKRNEVLLGKAAKAFEGEKWEEFKNMSGLFRSRVLTGEEYYNYCKCAMSKETFANIFPELLALLPDINLQLSLWKNYEGDKIERKNPLLKCVVCNQIVGSSDLKEHNFRHNLQNSSLPSPGNTKQKKLPKAWARK